MVFIVFYSYYFGYNIAFYCSFGRTKRALNENIHPKTQLSTQHNSNSTQDFHRRTSPKKVNIHGERSLPKRSTKSPLEVGHIFGIFCTQLSRVVVLRIPREKRGFLTLLRTSNHGYILTTTCTISNYPYFFHIASIFFFLHHLTLYTCLLVAVWPNWFSVMG